MSAHLDRAVLLLQQSRPADAVRELGRVLAEQPDHSLALSYLALAQSHLGQHTEALRAADQAVLHTPDFDFAHYARAQALHRADRDDDAKPSAEEAIRLSPDDERNHALLASIRLSLRDWAGALEAAERALAINPGHVPSANLRAMALVRLGRMSEATQAVAYALENDPNDALSHANQGWNELHHNRPRPAMEHFREALRLSPDFEYARQGMLEALRARNPVYRLLLRYFLWMGRQSRRLQWAVVIVSFLGLEGVRAVASENPDAGTYLWPLVYAFYAFVYLSWTAGPMFNLALRFDRFGRLVLSRDERVASNWFAACLALAGAGGWVAWKVESSLGLLIAIVGLILSMCVALTFSRQGKQRRYFGLATIFQAALGLGGLAIAVAGFPVGGTALEVFLVGFLLMQIMANVIAR